MPAMSLLYGEGTVTAPMLITALPRAEVQAWLPAALELGDQPITAGDRWPVVLMFGTQRGVRPNLWPCGGLDYHEFAVILPWLQLRTDKQPYRGPFVWSPQLFLDNRLAIALGKYIYGLDKIDAVIEDTGDVYRALTKGFGYSLVEGRFGEPREGPSELEFEQIRAILQQPIVSVFPSGRILFYGFEWQLAQEDMRAQRVEATAGRFFLSGLPGAPERHVGDGFRVLTAAGFNLRASWRMMLPRCSSRGMDRYLAPWPGGQV
jgi:hypothetical protein